MTTRKQLRANRMNARLSTGPQTEEGKARSRENAMYHGYYSNLVEVSFEDPQIYKEIHEGLVNQFCPTSFTEMMMIDKLALAILRDMRLAAAESIAMDLLPLVTKNDPLKPIPTDPEAEAKIQRWEASKTVLSFEEQKKLLQLQAMLNNEARKLLADLIAEIGRNDKARQNVAERNTLRDAGNDNKRVAASTSSKSGSDTAG
jgi:hypothetical protein